MNYLLLTILMFLNGSVWTFGNVLEPTIFILALILTLVSIVVLLISFEIKIN